MHALDRAADLADVPLHMVVQGRLEGVADLTEVLRPRNALEWHLAELIR